MERMGKVTTKRGDRNLVTTFSKIRERVSESRQENSSFTTFVKSGVRADRKTVVLVLLSRLELEQTRK